MLKKFKIATIGTICCGLLFAQINIENVLAITYTSWTTYDTTGTWCEEQGGCGLFYMYDETELLYKFQHRFDENGHEYKRVVETKVGCCGD